MDETCSLVYRLEERYLDDGDDSIDEDLLLGKIASSPCKVANSGRLELVVLNHLNISHIGNVNRFADLVGHVQEADLAWNRLHDWKTVANMLVHLPHLRVLNLSHNPLHIDEEEIDFPEMPHLQMVILNGTNLSYNLLRRLFEKMPKLAEVHLSEYQFGEDNKQISLLSSSVEILHINRCGLTNFQQVVQLLNRFPKLQAAFVVDNPIEKISKDEAVDQLLTLKRLNLSKTNIRDWQSIDSLAALPSLFDVRITNVPLFEGITDEERHALLIGRMPNLRFLNGSEICATERETAERFFIRYYQNKNVIPDSYYRLVQRHGNLEELVKIDLTRKSHIRVKLECDEAQYSGYLIINLNKKIGQFMRSVEKLCGMKYIQMRMFHTAADGYTQQCSLHNLQLLSLRIDEGDTLTIMSKTLPISPHLVNIV